MGRNAGGRYLGVLMAVAMIATTVPLRAAAVTPDSPVVVPSGIHPRNAAALEAGDSANATSVAAFDVGSFIDNGFVQLGVNPQGHLNVEGGPPSAGEGQTIVGLRWMLTNNDAISPGCQCEGWGAADVTSQVAGWASGADGIAPNLEVLNFFAAQDAAVSLVQIKNPAGVPVMTVRHLYEPVRDNPHLYQALVTITNVSDAPIEARYRRVMDWDVEPTAFDEWVTLKGNPANEPWLAGMTNDGFAHPSPLRPRTNLGLVGEGEDFPHPNPTIDQGALFDLDFGSLAPDNRVAFTIYYGVAGNEADALAALDKVGANVYSLGQPEPGRVTGEPNTFMFGFGRPISCEQEDFGLEEVRSDMAVRNGLSDVVVKYDPRTLVDPRIATWEQAAPEVAKAVLKKAEEALDRYRGLQFDVPNFVEIEITCDLFFRIPHDDFRPPPETAGIVEAASKMKLRTKFLEEAFRTTVLAWDPADQFVPPDGFWEELINHESFHTVQIQTSGEIDRGIDFLVDGDRTRTESTAMAAQELDGDWDDVPSNYSGRTGGLLGERNPQQLKDKSAIDHEVEGFGAPYEAGLIYQYWAERAPGGDPDLERRLASFLRTLIARARRPDRSLPGGVGPRPVRRPARILHRGLRPRRPERRQRTARLHVPRRTIQSIRGSQRAGLASIGRRPGVQRLAPGRPGRLREPGAPGRSGRDLRGGPPARGGPG